MREPSRLAALLRAGDREACIALRDGEPLSRGAFLERVAAWQATLAPRGERSWALFMSDAFEFAAALFGAWAAGCRVAVPGDALPATVAALSPRVEGFLGEFETFGEAPMPVLRSPSTQGAPHALPVLDEIRCELEVFTSGSSGQPVAVRKRLHQLAREVETIELLWGDCADGARIRGTVSHQHLYGLLFRVLWPLAAGRVLDARALPYAEDIVAAAGEGPFVLIASPAHLRRLPPDLEWGSARAAIRAVFSSGGPLPAEAAADCERLIGVSPFEVFGSTETGGIAVRQRSRDGERWQPMPGVHWRIERDAAGQEGALAVSSPFLPDAQWHVTADRVHAEADGAFRLLGRADRIVKLEEKRVSLAAVEQALLACEHVEDARVIVLPGARQQLGAVVTLDAAGRAQLVAQGRRAVAGLLRARLADSLEAVALPRRWRFPEALPVNAQGKSTQAALAALFDDAAAGPQVLQAQHEAAWVRERWHIPAGLPCFAGHFPGAPVLPGVVQIDWVIDRARRHFDMPGTFHGVDALKFQRVLRPGEEVDAELHWRRDEGVLNFTLTHAGQACASGRVRFGMDGKREVGR